MYKDISLISRVYFCYNAATERSRTFLLLFLHRRNLHEKLEGILYSIIVIYNF